MQNTLKIKYISIGNYKTFITASGIYSGELPGHNHHIILDNIIISCIA
jgi:hypothetical protein